MDSHMPAVAQAVLDELEEIRERWWLYTLLYNLSLAGAYSMGLLWLAVTADWRWQLPIDTRISVFLGWCVVSLGMLGVTLIYALARQRSLAAAARRLESVFPELKSDLINLVQLAELPTDDPFWVAAAEEAAGRVVDVPLELAPYNFSPWRRWRLGLHTSGDLLGALGVLLISLALSLMTYFLEPDWPNSLHRLLLPWRTTETT